LSKSKSKWWNRSGRKQRVLIAVPTYDGEVTDGIAKRMHEAGVLSGVHAHPFTYEPFIIRNFRPVEFARNLCADFFLKGDGTGHPFEWLYFWDADMTPPANWTQLLAHGRRMASGLAFGWQDSGLGKPPSLLTCVYRRNEADEYLSMRVAAGPFEADAAGAACLLLRRDVLEAAGPAPFMPKYGKMGEVLLGEDVTFFDTLRKVDGWENEKVLVDPGVSFGHVKRADLNDIGVYGMAAKALGAKLMAEGGR